MRIRYLALLTTGALVALLLFAGQGGAPAAQALLNDTDGDSVIDVAEAVTGSNPSDAHSTPEEIFADLVLGTTLCVDGLDNDGDGAADDGDTGCIDSDDDAISDNMEAIVGSDPEDSESFPEDGRFDAVLESLGFGFFQSCANGADDDLDGVSDAADSGCDPILTDTDAFDDRVEKLFGSDPTNSNSVPEHELVNPGSCSDATDNDRDGMIDNAEISCRPASNDSFNTPRAIGSIPFEDAVKITSATTESGEPESECAFDPPATVWYTYTAAEDGALAVDTAGSNFPNSIAIWTHSGNRFQPVNCATGFSPQPFAPVGARASFHATAGETYYIQVAGFIFPSEPADLRLTLDVGHPPANDNFASPRQITSIPFQHAVNVADATTEFGEPSANCMGEPYASVWYRFDATSDRLLIADTQSSSYPAGIAIWTDSAFGLTNVGCASYNGRVAFNTEPGRSYYIQIAALEEGFAGQLDFVLQEGVSPPNDDFDDATNVTSLPFEDTVDTFTATREFGEPGGSCSFGEAVSTVWYKTTAQQSGYIRATISSFGDDFFPAVLAIYQGTSLDDLTEIACANPYFDGSDSAAVQVSAGQTVYLQAAPLSFGDDFGIPDRGSASAAGFGPDGEITVRIEALTAPSCAPSTLTHTDPTGDIITFGGPSDDGVDITSVSGGHDGSNYCLRVQFAEPLPPPPDEPFEEGTSIRVGIDTDSQQFTGFGGGLHFPCDGGLGRELGIWFDDGEVLVPVDMFPPPPIFLAGDFPQPSVFAFALYGEQSVSIVIPMSAIGDDNFLFALSVENEGRADCAPNGGAIVSPRPPEPGDVNCDGETNSLDSSLILQRFAGILFGLLPCEYAGDVNQNGGVGPIDAVLILQYSAGMISEFTPEG